MQCIVANESAIFRGKNLRLKPWLPLPIGIVNESIIKIGDYFMRKESLDGLSSRLKAIALPTLQSIDNFDDFGRRIWGVAYAKYISQSLCRSDTMKVLKYHATQVGPIDFFLPCTYNVLLISTYF